MKTKHYMAVFALVGSLTAAHAQDIPPLADVIQNMDPQSLQQMATVGGQIEPITGDVDAVINTAVNDAVRDGVIAADQAADATASLTIINANAEYFNFDILGAIGDAVSGGDVSMSEVRSTLEAFNRLSPAGKAIVGNENFDVTDSNNALFGQLSQADRTIVLGAMPVFQNDLANCPGGQAQAGGC